MPKQTVSCLCNLCQSGVNHADQRLHADMNLLMSRLDEPQRRWFAAVESRRFGYGGDAHVSQIIGLDRKTIRRGRQELEDGLVPHERGLSRSSGAGQPKIEKKA